MGTFSYGIEEDTIQYDAEAAINMLQGDIDSDLSQMSKNLYTLIQSMNDLQKVAYDKANTAVTEDYKDMESLIGSVNDGTGVNGFLEDANTLCQEMLDTVVEWQRINSK